MRQLRILRALQDAEIRAAEFSGRRHLVMPVVAMIGDAVVRPLGSDGPEYVPASELASVPKGLDGRPVVPDHPENGTVSANQPRVLERWSYGITFNSSFRDNRLRTEAWIDPDRAELVGGDAGRVAELAARALAGEDIDPIEISLGVFVKVVPEKGTAPSGEAYSARWQSISYDHLAVGLNGAEGACSVEMGCGTPRVNTSDRGQPPAVFRAATRSKARRPAYNGTESSSWSAPSFGDYVRAYFEGDDPPAAVGDAPADLKRTIASKTLLGDPAADSFRDLAFFPVVNPETDRLNERALRAVLGGRGSQADIPDAARESAQAMARRLLNDEYGAELEVNVRIDAKAKARAAAEGMSDTDLREMLRQAIADLEPDSRYVYVEAVFGGQVVYIVARDDEPERTYERDYQLSNGSVSVGDQRREVVRQTTYRPAARSLIRQLHADYGLTTNEGEGMSELWMKLSRALESVVPAFGGIEEVFPDDGQVVYIARPNNEPALFRRSYSVDGDGAIEIGDDEQRVEPNLTYEPVAAASAECQCDGDCSCQSAQPVATRAEGGESDPDASTTANDGRTAQQKGEPLSDRLKELVDALIACEGAPYDESDRELLAAFPEERLAAFLEDAEAITLEDDDPVDTDGEAAADPDSVDPDEVRVSRADFDRMKAAADAHEAREAQEKAKLVSSLVAAQNGFTEDELKGWPLAQLKKLAAAQKLDEPKPDYRGSQVLSEPGGDLAPFAAPDGYRLGKASEGAN